MGWDSGTLYEKSSQLKSLINGANTINFNNISIAGTNGINLKTRITISLGNYVAYTSSDYNRPVTQVMPAEVTINMNPSSGKPYRYIYVDHPEFIRKIDTLEQEGQTVLMHVNDLSPNYTYVLAEYHHKATSSSHSNPFSNNDTLYYDAAFCGPPGATLKINKIGYAHRNWLLMGGSATGKHQFMVY